MTIAHHPPDEILSAYAAGSLDHGQHIAIATHLLSCAHCRGVVRTMEAVGGAMLADGPPATMASDALAAVEARLDEPARMAAAPAAPTIPASEVPGLPGFVRRYPFGRWTFVAPSVHMRPIILPHASDTRVFLLRSGPGTRMMQHTHTGIEMTCILAGAFQQDGAHYGPGDFDMGDASIDHLPVVDEGEECICLVAMQGRLRLRGVIGRIVQPFIRL